MSATADTSPEQAAAAILPLLGRRDRRAIYLPRTNTFRREDGDPGELLGAHLAGELLLGVHHGGEATTLALAVDIDGAEHTSQGDDADPLQARAALDRAGAELGLMPALPARSKGGSGIHLRWPLSEPVDTALANRVARALVRSVGRAEADVAYPSGPLGDGLVLALPWCGLTGRRPAWLHPAGSRFAHPVSGEVYEDQLLALTGWPRSTPAMVRHAAAKLGTLEDDSKPPRPVRNRSAKPLPRYHSELDTLGEHCAFIEHAAREASTLTYDDWFALASILRPFAGGKALFIELSKRDRDRYAEGEPAAKLDSVSGAPRHCANLDFRCPREGDCAALGVKSPAGLPFKLRAQQRSNAR